MIDNYLLEELVTFSQEKTLAKTAAKLMVTQPTVTRGMQKLEEELAVQLFDRQPNRIVLTDTGKLAAKKAAAVLQANKDFISQVQNYAAQQQALRIGSVAPGPLFLLKNNWEQFNQQIAISEVPLKPHDIANQLHNNKFSLIITNQEIQTADIESRYLGDEKLFVNLDRFMYLANLQHVTFAALKGISFVVVNDIGPWKKIIQKEIPDAKFLYQNDIESLNEITKYSSFPYFSTNIAETNVPGRQDDNRIRLPIIDDVAKMPFYASYLISQKGQLSSLLQKINQLWNQY